MDSKDDSQITSKLDVNHTKKRKTNKKKIKKVSTDLKMGKLKSNENPEEGSSIDTLVKQRDEVEDLNLLNGIQGVNEELRKLGLIDQSSKSKRSTKDYYRLEPNRDLLHEKLEKVAKEKADLEELSNFQDDEDELIGNKTWEPTGNEIRPSDMKFCLKHTNFTSDEIENWFQGFRVECPNGRLTKNHLHSLFCKLLPGEDSEAFCNHIFRIFDNDGNNFLDFKEFLMALDVSSLRSEREKLEWAFRLYDSDYSGSINLKEIKAVMETFSALEGIDSTTTSDSLEEINFLEKMPLDERAEYIFSFLDVDNDGEVSQEEFVEGYLKLKSGNGENNDVN